MADKTIDRDTYLKAFALATLANDLSLREQEIRASICAQLGVTDAYHIDDAVYDDKRLTVASFDEALKREGFSLAKED